MDAIQFIHAYPIYLEEIREVTKPELHYLVDELSKTDPHDLVKPDTWFPSESSAKGYVWSMFVNRAKKLAEPSH